jgi:hypothetical protein
LICFVAFAVGAELGCAAGEMLFLLSLSLILELWWLGEAFSCSVPRMVTLPAPWKPATGGSYVVW